MPSIHKRINLTVPDDTYQRIQTYKQQHGCSNDAGACLQMIVQYLNSLDEGERMFRLIQDSSIETLQTFLQTGASEIKRVAQLKSAISEADKAADL